MSDVCITLGLLNPIPPFLDGTDKSLKPISAVDKEQMRGTPALGAPGHQRPHGLVRNQRPNVHLGAGGQAMKTHPPTLALATLAIAVLAVSAGVTFAPKVIWNGSNSAPKGFCWLSDIPAKQGDLVLVFAPYANIMAGSVDLKSMFDAYGYPGLFGAYNAGPKRFEAHLRLEKPLPSETRDYMAKLVDLTGKGGDFGPEKPVATDKKAAIPFPKRILNQSCTSLFFPLRTLEKPDGKDTKRPLLEELFVRLLTVSDSD